MRWLRGCSISLRMSPSCAVPSTSMSAAELFGTRIQPLMRRRN
jgi:hypothetical protein